MPNILLTDQLMYSRYYAPRGRDRMMLLGQLLGGRYLSPLDRLIGVIGDAGAGKSSLVRGIFPGLELTNDDDGVNVRPLPLLKNIDRGFFTCHTYHVDMRFELAFTQIHELADAVKQALEHGKRVVVEHFDLLYPVLKQNADVIVGVGGEVLIARPTVFGPVPKDVSAVVVKTLQYRKMAHTAEDLTQFILCKNYNMPVKVKHRDVHHGFVLEYDIEPKIDIKKLEKEVLDIIEEGVKISYFDEKHIKFDDEEWFCSGPRTHVKNTEDIEGFRLLPEITYDRRSKTYLLIGQVGEKTDLDGMSALGRFSNL